MATTSTAEEVDRRRRRLASEPATVVAGLRALLREFQLEVDGASWDFDQYRSDPVAFALDILGAVILENDEPPDVETLERWKREKRLILWTKQVEILRALATHKRVAVRSGHKIGKSTTAAILALWFYCCFDDARVVLTATTARQVDAILWREVRKLYKRAIKPIPGELYELARSGLKSEDFREVVGFTAKESEAVAGVSGANLLYLVDEASGVPDLIFEAIEGNRAGGARIVLFGNPTRTSGEFFEAHHDKAIHERGDGKVVGFYLTVAVSSEETPNVKHGREIVPGLATREWVEEKSIEWGVDSALFKIRVRGEHALNEAGKIIGAGDVTEAEARWFDEPATGRLYIGVDPAGEGGFGDESTFVPRRGKKALKLIAMRGLTAEGHVAVVEGIIREEKEHAPEDHELPIVVVDRDGPEGAKVYNELRAVAEKKKTFIVVGFRGGEWAKRKPDLYDRQRDELWGTLAEWIKNGGAIPEDTKLAKELTAPEWSVNLRNKLKATPKEELRKLLDRSPDRADGLALSTWEVSDFVERTIEQQKQARTAPVEQRRQTFDAYSGGDAWRPRRG